MKRESLPGEDFSVESLTSRLERTEALLRAIIENTTAAIFVKDADGRYTLVNRRCEQLWQRDRQELLGRDDRQLFPPKIAEEIIGHDREIWASGEARELEEIAEFPDGRRYFQSSKVPLLDSSGQPLALCGVATDITEQKRVEQALRDEIAERRKAEQALRETDQRKNDFLAALGHELRNPLSPLTHGVEILKRVPQEDPRRVEVLERMERQLAQLRRLVEDLLDVARISRGTIELVLEEVDLGQLVRTTVEDHRDLFEQRGLHLGYQRERGLGESGPTVSGDRARLTQILENLLLNAQKFTASGGRVEVELRTEAPTGGDGARAVILIRDTGIGIEPENLEKIFGAYTSNRGDASSPGLGLGLSVVRTLVEMHHGEVKAQSDGPGKGSTFVVRLPCRAD